jgi:hypothetical protein
MKDTQPSGKLSEDMDLNDSCHRVCLTPTRNESWIIKRFLAASKCWANHIIVADQGSTDGTLQQLQGTPGVDVVINDSPIFDEVYRQRLLINKARQIKGKRVLIALDADEALSSNCVANKEWEQIEKAEPGTLLRFRWVNILPGFKQAWIPDEPLLCGFVDNGLEHTGKRIHNPRVPCPAGAPVIDIKETVVLHFQYVLWERMASKNRWYQAWEYTKHKQKSPFEIFREYSHMYGGWEKREIYPMQPEWLEGYDRAGVDFRSLTCESVTWWDREVVQMLCQHGPGHFRKLAIWDKDWNATASQIGVKGVDLSDPRSPSEKLVHRLLAATQKHRTNLGVRAFERFLRATGW